MIKNLLAIAGSDPSGGAGIQADLKSFSARATYGMAAITALTAQNTCGVSAIHIPDPAFLDAQLKAIFSDIKVHGIKIGMIANVEIGKVIKHHLRRHQDILVVLDPVMIAKGGAKLLNEEANRFLTDELMPLATVVTPNLPEAAALLGADKDTATTRPEMEHHARALLDRGARAILLKGGHLDQSDSPDLIATKSQLTWIEGPRLQTRNTHGTGCSLSSALAAELAKGRDLIEAAKIAKSWLHSAIKENHQLDVGSGHGPVHHFHAIFD